MHDRTMNGCVIDMEGLTSWAWAAALVMLGSRISDNTSGTTAGALPSTAVVGLPPGRASPSVLAAAAAGGAEAGRSQKGTCPTCSCRACGGEGGVGVEASVMGGLASPGAMPDEDTAGAGAASGRATCNM